MVCLTTLSVAWIVKSNGIYLLNYELENVHKEQVVA